MEGNAATANNTVGVKLSYEGQMRRFPYTGSSFAAFYEQILGLLDLEKTAEVVLKYSDEEGDLITISSDLELKSAIVPGQLLRLVVVPKNKAPVAPALAPQQVQQAPAQVYQHPNAHPQLGEQRAPWEATPFGPAGNFGSFKHGCGGDKWERKMGEKWQKKMRKMEKTDDAKKLGEKWEKKMHKRGKWDHNAPHHHHHDRHHGEKAKYVARFVADVTIEDGTVIPPLTPFVKTWRIRNEGPEWPASCTLVFVSKHSDNMNAPSVVTVETAVPTNTEINISVNLIAPAKAGRYTGYWRMCSPDGRKFGQRVWASIIVPAANGSSSSSSDEEKADKYEALVDVVLRNEMFRSIGIKRHWVFRLLQKTDGDVDKVTSVLNNKIEKKLKKQMKHGQSPVPPHSPFYHPTL